MATDAEIKSEVRRLVKAVAKLDLSLVPGTPKEQRELANTYLRRRTKPIEIRKDGKKWALIVLGVTIGFVSKKSEAQHAAHTIGSYRLELGDFVDGYTAGY